MIVLTAIIAALTAALAAASRQPARQRLMLLRPAPAIEASTAHIGRLGPGRLAVVGGGSLLAGVAVLGVIRGLLAAAAVTAALRLIMRRTTPTVADAAAASVMLDLVAGCLRAGAALPDALACGRASHNATVRDSCSEAAASLRAGAMPDQAFASWSHDPTLAPAGRVLRRTWTSGAGSADELCRCADRLRMHRRTELRGRVQQVSVWVVVPLGVCFLPAFVLVAVVPMVIGLFPALR